jgi:hypothetical protein
MRALFCDVFHQVVHHLVQDVLNLCESFHREGDAFMFTWICTRFINGAERSIMRDIYFERSNDFAKVYFLSLEYPRGWMRNMLINRYTYLLVISTIVNCIDLVRRVDKGYPWGTCFQFVEIHVRIYHFSTLVGKTYLVPQHLTFQQFLTVISHRNGPCHLYPKDNNTQREPFPDVTMEEICEGYKDTNLYLYTKVVPCTQREMSKEYKHNDHRVLCYR